jgi:hypothetical protein
MQSRERLENLLLLKCHLFISNETEKFSCKLEYYIQSSIQVSHKSTIRSFNSDGALMIETSGVSKSFSCSVCGLLLQLLNHLAKNSKKLHLL